VSWLVKDVLIVVSAERASCKRQKLQLNFSINVMIEAEEYKKRNFFYSHNSLSEPNCDIHPPVPIMKGFC